MKKFIFVFILGIIIASCGSDTTSNTSLTDTLSVDTIAVDTIAVDTI